MTRTTLGGLLGTVGVMTALFGCGGAVDLKTESDTSAGKVDTGGTRGVDDSLQDGGGKAGRSDADDPTGDAGQPSDSSLGGVGGSKSGGGSSSRGGVGGSSSRGGSGSSLGGASGSAGSGFGGSSGSAGSNSGWLWDLNCPDTVEDYCATDGAVCIDNWDSARHVDDWCANSDVNAIAYMGYCNGFYAVIVYGIDALASSPNLTNTYYYDTVSEELVRVDSNRLPSYTQCVAGASGTPFEVSGCEFTFTECR